jgi:hypothetical protein
MTAAIFGLIGVLVGGVLNGAVSWLIELSRQRDAARASARLLSHELRGNLRVLDEAIGLVGKSKERPEAAADKLRELSQTQWTEHKSRLAQGLRAEDFELISGAYVNLHEIDTAASRLRGLAAAASVESKSKASVEDMVMPAVRAASLGVAGLPGLEILAVAGAVPALVKAWRDVLSQVLAKRPLESARARTQAALEITSVAGEDSVLRRTIQRRRRPRHPSHVESQRLSTVSSPSGKSGTANSPRRERAEAAIAAEQGDRE